MKTTSKESTSSLFNRYVWLVDLIYRMHNISFAEINERWQRSPLNNTGDELPLRTFRNHLAAIETMFDINIACNRSNGYKYHIENNQDIDQGGVRQWLINTFAVNNLINESHALKSRILFEHIPSGQQYLTQLVEAMRDNITINLNYQSFREEQPNIRIVEPYCVKVFNQRWYLLARNTTKDRLTTYALDRIHHIAETDQRFTLPKNFSSKDYFTHAYGIIASETLHPEHITIKVYDKQVRYIQTLPLHHTQCETQTTPQYSIFTYHLAPTDDFIRQLLTHTPNLEVLTPISLRHEITHRLRLQLQHYK